MIRKWAGPTVPLHFSSTRGAAPVPEVLIVLLVITEKPSVAREIGGVLGCKAAGPGLLEGDGVRITWCLGHLCELDEPKAYTPEWARWSFDALPMVPDRFRLRVRDEPRTKEQWAILKKQLLRGDVREVVNACDAGREGELIFRYVYELAGCKRPVSRLWVASLTDRAIRAAWATRRPGQEYDGLADAARSRSEADWIVGLNATRALTLLARGAGGDQLYSVGRVQTPTLAMIVARDLEIERFVPEPYWRVEADLELASGHALKARWFRHDAVEVELRPAAEGEPKAAPGEEEALPVERLPSAAVAEGLARALAGGAAEVQSAERVERREKPPLLYDLTALQRRANQRYGLNAEQTLAIAQELYERKLISYPRTDARFITDDQVPELPGILRGLSVLGVYRPFCEALLAAPIRPGRRVVNAAEVGDHHAILPTGLAPDGGRLGPDQKRIYDLVARRLFAALSDDAVFDVTTLILSVPPTAPLPPELPAPPHLRARGRVCRQEGWQAADPPGRRTDRDLPLLREGDRLPVRAVEVHEAATRPPRPHNDASLLQKMETAGRELDDAELKRALRGAGLGTPATRAAVITTLITRRFVERAGKDLRATPMGRELIAAVPIEALKSPELTGRWEARLSAIAEKGEQRGIFMRDVAGWAAELVAAIQGAAAPPVQRRAAEGAVVGPCPACGGPVRELRGRYRCEAGGGCTFEMWGTVAGREISRRMAKQLMVERKTPVVKGFKSKAGKAFEAALLLNDQLKVVFDFPERAARPPAPPDRPEGMRCPSCRQGEVIAGGRNWGCSRWREGCRWMAPFSVEGEPVDPQAVAAEIAAALTAADRSDEAAQNSMTSPDSGAASRSMPPPSSS